MNQTFRYKSGQVIAVMIVAIVVICLGPILALSAPGPDSRMIAFIFMIVGFANIMLAIFLKGNVIHLSNDAISNMNMFGAKRIAFTDIGAILITHRSTKRGSVEVVTVKGSRNVIFFTEGIQRYQELKEILAVHAPITAFDEGVKTLSPEIKRQTKKTTKSHFEHMLLIVYIPRNLDISHCGGETCPIRLDGPSW